MILDELQKVHLVSDVATRVAFDDAAFRFEFSTGFRGRFWRDPDGSFTLRFHGDRLADPEDARRSQSKFIISRCKYSGNLPLILQDDATVHLM
jgi:hypothetical protein